MRGKSHIHLGLYLADRYMKDIPKPCIRAFLFGCIEPDRNPITYLKGSLRCQWLRGHNYHNARRFMRKISRRLEKKRGCLNLFDFYTLGKLIHYTTDAFTSAHNSTFSTNLVDHREYEVALQEHFIQYLQDDPDICPKTAKNVMDIIYQHHAEYEALSANIYTDSKFALAACCCVVALLFAKPVF